MTPLGGSSDPINYPAIRNTQPLAINDSGQIVGNNRPYPNLNPDGFYNYSNDQINPISYPSDAPNQGGWVLGATVSPSGASSPVISNVLTHTQQDLGQAPGATSTVGQVINDSGEVAGITYSGTSSQPNINQGAAFLYSDGKMTNIGSLGGPTFVTGLNDSGEVIGTSGLNSGPNAHAFLYANGKMTDLGTLQGYQSSYAMSINAQGQVVGDLDSSIGQVLTTSAFLYSNDVMTNLNNLINPNSGWTIVHALEINNLGQILAQGLHGSTAGYLLLTPSDLPPPGDPVYPVIMPEPSSLAIYGVMAAGLALRFRGWRRS